MDKIATRRRVSDRDELRCASIEASVTRWSNLFGYVRANGDDKSQNQDRQIRKTEMLQKARAALPLSKLRDRAFEGAFFSVALIAMAGWVYFIALLLVRLFVWFFS